MGDITRADVQGFVEKLLDLEYAPATARRWLTAVQVFGNWLVEEGELAISPATHVRAPQLPERLTRTLSEEEARRLIRACHGDDFGSRRDDGRTGSQGLAGARSGLYQYHRWSAR